ncbi:hypothetical protein LPUS_07754 [Lasallia pustulata]|uniref:Uncharacterized protein n=1 Tax=Lasallia pustulata TaxID=136370 RepID=A0A1W5D410_9LECA|nr:hypothetical protein LPUS_07754 [Lasallia pustulata]
MGYTHSWEVRDWEAWAAAFPLIVYDARIIISHSGVPIGGPEPETDGPCAPLVSETEGIALNGDQGDCHEPFILEPYLCDRAFCKTARKAYDMVVTAILIRAKKHAGDAFRVSSDGSWDEWENGKEILEHLWPDEDVVCPLERDDDEDDGYEQGAKSEGYAAGEETEESEYEGASPGWDHFGAEFAEFPPFSNSENHL